MASILGGYIKFVLLGAAVTEIITALVLNHIIGIPEICNGKSRILNSDI